MKPIRANWAAPCITGALLFGFGATGSAFAQGFGMTGYVSETFDVTENAELDNVSEGTTITSTTSFGLSLLSETEVSSFGLDLGTSIYLVRNPNGSSSAELGYPSVSLSYDDTTSSKSFSVGASYRVTPAGDGRSFLVDDIDDDGVIDPGETSTVFTDALQSTLSASGSYSADVTANDTLRLTVRASRIDFEGDDPDLIPSARQSIRLGWTHQLSDDLSGGLSVSNSWFSNEAAIPVSSETTSVNGNISYDVNNTMVIAGSLGVERATIDEGGSVTSTDSLDGGATIDYELADGFLGAYVDFGLRPSDGGLLQQTASLGVDYTKTINAVSSLSVAFDVTMASDPGEAVGTGERTFRFTPTYSHQITNDISGDIGYRYEQVDDAVSHGVFLGISKNFEFLK